MILKICGITNIEDALLCAGLGAQALGFIFYSKSKRCVSVETAAEIIKQLPPFVAKVGVFVNASESEINTTIEQTGITTLQLHGEESPEFCSQFSLPVIKAFRVHNDFDYSRVPTYGTDYFLFDTYSPTEYGGTGLNFNWSGIPEQLRDKAIIAGGINSDSLRQLANQFYPLAVDVASSLESEPGKKDKQKVKQFFKTLNELRSSLWL